MFMQLTQIGGAASKIAQIIRHFGSAGTTCCFFQFANFFQCAIKNDAVKDQHEAYGDDADDGRCQNVFGKHEDEPTACARNAASKRLCHGGEKTDDNSCEKKVFMPLLTEQLERIELNVENSTKIRFEEHGTNLPGSLENLLRSSAL